MKLKKRAVIVIGPRFENDINLRSRIATERSIVSARENLELADGVDRWTYAEGVQLRVNVVNAVEQEVVTVFARAVYAESEIATH